MTFLLLALLFLALSAACFFLVLVHAFRRSLGTGFMVLCLPPYNFYYGFSQFEHRHKGLVLAGWLGSFFIGVVLKALGVALARG